MRPFYEQYFYDKRPREKVGDQFIKFYVTDFVDWHAENLAATPHRLPKQAYMTAHSALSDEDFRDVCRRGIGGYFKKNGVFPGFLTPRSYGEMNILNSLLMPMPKIMPADKLNVGRFIPQSLSDHVRTVPVIRKWQIGEEVSFDGIKPGTYFFKSNHGSNHVIRVELPCSDEELAHIRSEAKRWLGTSYGKNTSQWWYRFIKRQVFLEPDLQAGTVAAPLTDFRFHVINGKVALLQLEVGQHTDERNNPVYDGDLNYLPQDFLRENYREVPLPENTDKARDLAQMIGRGFQFCRVDFYLRGEEIFLGELTFLPNAGRRPVRSPELNERLCSYWTPMPRFVRVG